MGVYDREYMDDPETATHRYTAVWTLIGINVIVWLIWQFGASNDALRVIMHEHFTVSPHGLLDNYYIHTLLTAAISHSDLQHIFFNMLFLYVLGGDLEIFYGRRNFFFLYAFCGVIASLGHVGFYLALTNGNTLLGAPALGASGAIMGLAVVAAFVDPHKPINLLGLVRVELKWLVIAYIALDLIGMSKGAGDGIARAAHLTGAAAGFVFWKLDLRWFESRGRKASGLLHRLKLWFRRRNVRVLEKIPDGMPRETVASHASSRSASAGSASYATDVDAQTSQRVDELLTKISRNGIHSLSKDEQAFLEAASAKYRKRQK